MKINKKSRSPLIIGVLILVVLVFYVLSIVKTRNNEVGRNTGSELTNEDKPKSVSCTRTTRLDNAPQYDRALSFIQQRINENLDRFIYNPMHLFKYFPPQLVNCIKIIEETPNGSNDFEGYFTFNGKDIKTDYYPIVVNSKYVQSDDVLIAMLLTHEMTHVQQYIDSVNNKTALACVDSEVQAFLSTYRFFISGLNSKEGLLIWGRIDEAVENSKRNGSLDVNRPFDGQLLMLHAIIDMRNNTTCKLEGKLADQVYYDCVDAQVLPRFKQLIEKDDYYKKQCGL